ncbi:hypothetical protein DWV84_24160 [Blautia sp. AF13-16]|nr:hypothetical protein DWV84_24160 [Blautia sp. AF13-16]
MTSTTVTAYFKDIKGGECMEVIKDGETTCRIHDDFCCQTEEEVKTILDIIAQTAFQHLNSKEKTA